MLRRTILILGTLLSAGGMLLAQAAAGNLMVSPARVVFEGRTRSEELILGNTGTETAVYRIKLVHMAMTEGGGIKEIPDGPDGVNPDMQNGVDPAQLVRYSPHQVTLEPGQSQVLRVMLRKPAQLAEGEYRIHMLFQAVPNELAGGKGPTPPPSQKGLSIRLTPIIGLAIPIIVRNGQTATEAGLTNLALEHSGERFFLDADLTRIGNASIYGDLQVDFTPAQGTVMAIGMQGGLAVYPPLGKRSVRIPLEAPKDFPGFSKGSLRLRFQAPNGGKVMAEADLRVP